MSINDPNDCKPYGTNTIPSYTTATNATIVSGTSYTIPTSTYGVAGVGMAGTATTAWYNGNLGDVVMTQPVKAPDVIIDGVSMKDSIAKIQERLAILVPDPELLEKYESLKELYSQYKMMEALLKEETKK